MCGTDLLSASFIILNSKGQFEFGDRILIFGCHLPELKDPLFWFVGQGNWVSGLASILIYSLLGFTETGTTRTEIVVSGSER